MARIDEAVGLAIQRGWIEPPVIPALYASAGIDTQAITLTHPAFLARQIGSEVEPPRFFVYVDRDIDPGETELAFDDRRTTIRTVEQNPFDIARFPAQLARLEI